MATLGEVLGGSFVLIYLAIIIFCVVATITGIIAAFGAAWWAGLICFIPPLGLVNGIIYIGSWGSINAAAKVVAWLVGAKAASLLLPYITSAAA